MKLHKIHINPYGVQLHVGFAKDPSKALMEIESKYKWMTKNSEYEPRIAGLHIYHPDFAKRALIILKPTSDIRTIVHEAFHCVVAICSMHGVPINTDNDEAGAYMLDYIVGRIVKLQKRENEQTLKETDKNVLPI